MILVIVPLNLGQTESQLSLSMLAGWKESVIPNWKDPLRILLIIPFVYLWFHLNMAAIKKKIKYYANYLICKLLKKTLKCLISELTYRLSIFTLIFSYVCFCSHETVQRSFKVTWPQVEPCRGIDFHLSESPIDDFAETHKVFCM